jgi:hypothetical protein
MTGRVLSPLERAIHRLFAQGFLGVALLGLQGAEPATNDVTYTLDRRTDVPLAISVVRVPRRSNFEIQSIHSGNAVIGLSPLSLMVNQADKSLGNPIAAINGDFYQRGGAFAGLPRGLQVLKGELLSPPSGGPTFWIDANDEPHLATISPSFQVTWPSGAVTPLGVNTGRRYRDAVLYTPSWGFSTRAAGGRELVLESTDGSQLLPLPPGRFMKARVREVRETGNTRLTTNTAVLSLGTTLASSVPRLAPGTEITLSTATFPSLKGVKAAISGGPILVKDGKGLRSFSTDDDSYETGTMDERHPRSAIGWNKDYFFLVEVDGRRRGWSIGVTLKELSSYLVRLGCTDAMNLDGGGSASLWYKGRIQSRPCDGYERPVANSIVVFQKRAP